MILNEVYTLSNGVEIPRLGFGTWFIKDTVVADAVRAAVSCGYRLVDTAQVYRNERGVGEGVRSASVARPGIFVTSKVGAELKTYDAAAKSIDGTLKTMGLDYLDMMIIHSPQPWDEWRGEKRYFEENREVWRALEDAYNAGKVRAIGVSNFLRDDLESLLPFCRIKPMVNQILVHIGSTQCGLIEYCKSMGILVQGYSPIGHGAMLENRTLKLIAHKYRVTVPQLCIRYVLQLGVAVLAKTDNPAHMKSNAELDFEISANDMEFFTGLEWKTDYGRASRLPVFSAK